MKIDFKDLVKNAGISFVGNFLLLNLIHMFTQLNYFWLIGLLIVNVAGFWSLENYQAKKNYQTKEKQLKYLKEHGFKDVQYRVIGVVFAIVLALLFITQGA